MGISYLTGECKAGCGNNEYYSGNKCLCKDGYGHNKNKECVDCSQMTGGFLIDGYCAYCPSGFIHDGQSCVCPSGSSEVNGKCTQSCEPGQGVDFEGNCFWCPINQVWENQCVCKAGYQKISGVCQLKCKPNQVVVNGICAQCALNTVYDPSLGSCVCAEGYYKNNYGFCEKTILNPVTCDPGYYFEENEGCRSCPVGCKTCKDASTCTSCTVAGFSPSGAQCVPKCGDGIIIYGKEQCDDSNSRGGDGCSSSCMVEDGWRCSGKPSSCEKIFSGPSCGDGVI